MIEVAPTTEQDGLDGVAVVTLAPYVRHDVVLEDLAVVHVDHSVGLPNLRATLATKHGTICEGIKVSGDAVLLGWDSESASPSDLPLQYVALYQMWLGFEVH